MSGIDDFKKAVAIQDGVKDFAEMLEATYGTRVVTCDEEGYIPGSLMPHDFIQVRILLSDEQNKALSEYEKDNSMTSDLICAFPSTSDCATEYDCGAVYHNYNEVYFHTAQGAVTGLLDRWNLPKTMASGAEYVTREERKAMQEQFARIIEEAFTRYNRSTHDWIDDLSSKTGLSFKHIDHKRAGNGMTVVTLQVEVPDTELGEQP
jgi:hypothetical protein